MIQCPEHQLLLERAQNSAQASCPNGCHFASPMAGYTDLLSGRATSDQTSEHYSLQWGPDVDFASFYRERPEALSVMTSKQMGWPDLIRRVRERGANRPTFLLDAACGYGGLFMDLFAELAPEHLRYVGADIHGALPSIKRPAGIDATRAQFVRWDISDPVPAAQEFDFVICRAAIHHTPDPRATFHSLVGKLAPQGTIAITVYAKKAPMREASDDALRAAIVPMDPRDALQISRQFTLLGRDLQSAGGEIHIHQDLPVLGIKAGRYGIQDFIYNHFLKCWYNSGFGEQYSDIVNFDWYHPPYAYRYELDEVTRWFEDHGLELTTTSSTTAQHYLEGHRRD
jgi:SAM-dependent methyltransferase